MPSSPATLWQKSIAVSFLFGFSHLIGANSLEVG